MFSTRQSYFCRVSFAQHSAKVYFAKYKRKNTRQRPCLSSAFILPSIFGSTRQKECLPSARWNAHGKPLGTRHWFSGREGVASKCALKISTLLHVNNFIGCLLQLDIKFL